MAGSRRQADAVAGALYRLPLGGEGQETMAAAFGYLATILAANWAIGTFGFVPVGFGLLAPAGVYFAGLGFTLRDLTQERLGRRWCLLVILVGAALSFLLGSGRIAAASGIAFLLSELADFAVYQPLRERRWLLAVALSNTVGAVVDSAIFLAIAFGSLDFIAGQLVGKSWVTLVAVAILWGARRAVSERGRERGYAHVGD